MLPRKTKKQKDRAREVLDDLYETYPNPHCALNYTTPFELLVATILSAQCTDVRVNQITPLLFKRADNPYDMVKLSVEEIADIIRPCGL